MAAASMIMERRFTNFSIKDSSNYIIQNIQYKDKNANLPVPKLGQDFCYHRYHKRNIEIRNKQPLM